MPESNGNGNGEARRYAAAWQVLAKIIHVAMIPLIIAVFNAAIRLHRHDFAIEKIEENKVDQEDLLRAEMQISENREKAVAALNAQISAMREDNRENKVILLSLQSQLASMQAVILHEKAREEKEEP